MINIRPPLNDIGIRILDGGYLVYKEGAAHEFCQAEYACESIQKVLDTVEMLLSLKESPDD